MIIIILLLLGVDPQALLQQGNNPQQPGVSLTPDRRTRSKMNCPSLCRSCWPIRKGLGEIFTEMGSVYDEPRLILFQNGCSLHVDSSRRPLDPFIARPTSRFISISVSTGKWNDD
ncbi:MAG: hypothetical protein R3C11_28960 [Planctomycetaceae bacterium]